MRIAKAAGFAWTSDVFGASVFAWGAASALDAQLQGTAGMATGAVLILLGGLLRLASQYGAQVIGFDEGRALARLQRSALFPRLLSIAGPSAPALGATATLGIDHIAA